MTNDALIAAVSPLLGGAGGAWYFTPETLAAGKAVGLDGMRFYFVGRGSVLGQVDWRVVAAAFGYFNPTIVEKMWTTGLERCPVDAARDAHLSSLAGYGRLHLAGLAELGPFCDAAEALVGAACRDLAGLTLFAGYAAQPLPDDLPARAMTLTAVLRELRGSAHHSAVVASGLASPVAHLLRRPDAMSMFGWQDGDIAEPGGDDRRRLEEADRMTDAALARAYAVLDEPAGAALLAGAEAIVGAIGREAAHL